MRETRVCVAQAAIAGYVIVTAMSSTALGFVLIVGVASGAGFIVGRLLGARAGRGNSSVLWPLLALAVLVPPLATFLSVAVLFPVMLDADLRFAGVVFLCIQAPLAIDAWLSTHQAMRRSAFDLRVHRGQGLVRLTPWTTSILAVVTVPVSWGLLVPGILLSGMVFVMLGRWLVPRWLEVE